MASGGYFNRSLSDDERDAVTGKGLDKHLEEHSENESESSDENTERFNDNARLMWNEIKDDQLKYSFTETISKGNKPKEITETARLLLASKSPEKTRGNETKTQLPVAENCFLRSICKDGAFGKERDKNEIPVTDSFTRKFGDVSSLGVIETEHFNREPDDVIYNAVNDTSDANKTPLNGKPGKSDGNATGDVSYVDIAKVTTTFGKTLNKFLIEDELEKKTLEKGKAGRKYFDRLRETINRGMLGSRTIVGGSMDCERIINETKDRQTVDDGKTGIEEKVLRPKDVSYHRAENCDFCQSRPQFMCKYCTFVYCKTCLEKLHPALGPYVSHEVIPVDKTAEPGCMNRCKEHGLAAPLFCSYCEVNRCTECVKTKCSLHFKGRVSDADVEKEKVKLVEEFERTASKLGFVEKYKENIHREIANIQMTGMFRREQIRQEFVSFHDLLIQKETKMLEQLDQEVNDRVSHVTDTLQASVKSLEIEDATLTTTVTELVQSSNDALFIEEYVKARDLCQEVDAKVRDFETNWTINSMYTPCPVLDNHFTMLHEKRHLEEKLEGTLEVAKLRFTQSTLFLFNQLLNISEYLVIPRVPPSVEVSYNVQLLQGKKPVYQLDTKNVQELVLNAPSTFALKAGSYLLRITPTYRRIAAGIPDDRLTLGQYTRRDDPCHMLILAKGANFKPKVKPLTEIRRYRAVRKATRIIKRN